MKLAALAALVAAVVGAVGFPVPAHAVNAYSYTATFAGASYNYCTAVGVGVQCNVYDESFVCTMVKAIASTPPSPPAEVGEQLCRATIYGYDAGVGLPTSPCVVGGTGTLAVVGLSDGTVINMPVTLRSDGATLYAVGTNTAAEASSTPACDVAPMSGAFQGTATYEVAYG